jgi:S1-C subfamily serine protease
MRIISLGATLGCLVFPLASLAAQHDGAPGHGRLGIFLEDRSDRADSAGVRVRGVVPDGPADKAGLEKGDVLLRLNGTTLSGAPKLMELARRLEPGDTAKVEYRRDGQTRTATVVADTVRPPFAMMFRRMPGGGFDFHGGPDIGGHDMLFFHTQHRAGLALVAMSRDLGEYFGTSDGFLVVKAPADSASPLKAGDVILAIDGRKPQSVEHAHRILGSYAPGEKAKLDIMRKRQRTSLTWTALERRQDEHFGPGQHHGMGPDEEHDSWGAMDFDLPAAPPDMDLTLPAALDGQET